MNLDHYKNPGTHGTWLIRGRITGLHLFTISLILLTLPVRAFEPDSVAAHYTEAAESIHKAAFQSNLAWDRLAEMCDTFGPRFSGSPNLEMAIDWIVNQLNKDGFDTVMTQPVAVPHWIRGREFAEQLEPAYQSLPMLGLGGSIATPPEGLVGEVFVVSSFEDLRENASQALGKIVLFNIPFTSYRETVAVRVSGAVEAARAGAIASLIRSVGHDSLQTPHTGGMSYQDGITPIPHAALSPEDAERLHRIQMRGERIVIRLKMDARTSGDAISHNVIADWKGSSLEKEMIVVGGHIDSWDVGQGAQDDGGGCMMAWHAIQLLKDLGLKPKRTLRLVLWTNEENGARGASAFAQSQSPNAPNILLAIESDSGTFNPNGFAFTGSPKAMDYIRQIAALNSTESARNVVSGAGGVDIRPLLSLGVPIMDVLVDRTHYFKYHHTHADTVDKVSRKDLQSCIASLATMLYVVADMPISLPR